MPDHLAVLDHVSSSNLPRHEKTAIRRFYERLAPRAGGLVSSTAAKLGLGPHTVVTAVEVVRATGEALLIGGAFGALDSQLGNAPGKSGLDVNVPVGTGYNVPIDAAVGIAGMGLSMINGLDKVSEDMNRVGVIGLASWAQRQAKSWMQTRSSASTVPAALPATAVAHGEFAEDPILSWAQNH